MQEIQYLLTRVSRNNVVAINRKRIINPIIQVLYVWRKCPQSTMKNQLTLRENIFIQCWAKLHQTPEQVERKIKRHSTTIYLSLKRWEDGVVSLLLQRSSKLSPRYVRQIRRAAINHRSNDSTIRNSIYLKISTLLVSQILADDSNIFHKRY